MREPKSLLPIADRCKQLMLTAPALTRRAICLAPLCARAYSNTNRGDNANSKVRLIAARQEEKDRTRPRRTERTDDGSRGNNGDSGGDGASKEPSLIEQLFPEEAKRFEETTIAKPRREIPRLPLDFPSKLDLYSPTESRDPRFATEHAVYLERLMKAQDKETSVLVLRNASPNLTEEDFRRLIPQGQHMQGWALEQGDIVKVIPGRDLTTLKQENYYYLLFASPLSAFVYQGQVARIHRLVATHSPSSLHSPLPPPPGFRLDGMDAHAAIQAYALVSPTQNLSLRQLKPPLTPLVHSLVRHQGYAALQRRPDRMPYEVRLSLEGPQLHMNRIRYIIYESGRERALAWSGSEDGMVQISKWDPVNAPSGLGRDIAANSLTRENGEDRSDSANRGERAKEPEPETPQRKPRPLDPVYIVGFHTDLAAQSFVRYWHRRPMEWGKTEVSDDLSPITNAEILW